MAELRVAIVVSHLQSGGPVDVEYNLCKQLLKYKSVEALIVTLRKETKNSRINDFRKLGVSVKQLLVSYVQCELNTKTICKRLQSIIDQEEVRIVHANGYHPVLACARLKRVKIVSTLHNRATEDFINVFGKIIGNYMLYRYCNALKNFDLNIGVSQSVAELYKQFITNVCFVNNGIDTDIYYPVADYQRIVLRKKLHLPENGIIMVSTGRIEKEKGYEDLIRWFVNNYNRRNIFLLILGNGGRLSKCRKVAQSDSHVLLPGRVSNVSDYLKSSDIYISNSRSEGMSMAVCEGIGSGLFPILSDIPSHRDVAKPIEGWLFTELSEINLDKVLTIRIDRTDLHNYIQKSFSVKSLGEGYLKLYKEIGCQSEYKE